MTPPKTGPQFGYLKLTSTQKSVKRKMALAREAISTGNLTKALPRVNTNFNWKSSLGKLLLTSSRR
jgi:hypothetical protein